MHAWIWVLLLAGLVVWFVASERRFKRAKARMAKVLGMDEFMHTTQVPRVPIVLALTSSPSRIVSSLPRVLQSIHSVSHDIRVVLPRLFRNTDAYDEDAVAQLPATIVRIEDDLGPLTKALPVLAQVSDTEDDCVVVTLDDDALYHPDDIIALANRAHEEGRIATGFARWDDVLEVWVPFGNNAVAYPKALVTRGFIAQVKAVHEQGGPSCRMHDDMVLAVAAARHGLAYPLTQVVRRNLLEDSFSDDSLMYAFPDKDVACAKQLL
jgi:CTP:molybdopterin cytidylyltransferase MocA